ncbi:MAG: 50S ribosomal protein L4 [Deltaproteobacteria bacterium]|jgi:large subunit ribosomal protein L4|nr:50S ribosomal protein L4 [Deltaproteobacteria bacterium]
MAEVSIYDQQKRQTGSVTLDPEIFEVPVRPEILNLVVRASRAEWRAGTHSTLTRSMMKGGGAKPWRQKGTGRARSGSGISPVWRGGAVIFGPQPRDYSFKVNKKVWRLALKMALSARLAEDRLLILNGIVLPEAKTKHAAGIRKALGLGKTLLVATGLDEALARSVRNLPDLLLRTPDQLNVYDILNHAHLVVLEDALDRVVARLSA